MFLGTYQTTFSGKGRIILPKRLREELIGNEILITRGLDGCIWGFDKKAWEEEAKRQLDVSVTDQRGRQLRRYIFSAAQPSELDKQGRFVIPGVLLIYADIKDKVVVVGAGDHFEIWNPKKWKKVINGSSGV